MKIRERLQRLEKGSANGAMLLVVSDALPAGEVAAQVRVRALSIGIPESQIYVFRANRWLSETMARRGLE